MIGRRNRFEFNTQNTIAAIVILAIIFFALFWIARGIFTILTYVAPFLLIATLIINYKIVVNYGKWLWKQLSNNPIMGVIAIVLTIVGFPLVSFMLFGKALLDRKVRQVQEEVQMEHQGSFADYEIIEDNTLELPPIPKEEVKIRKDPMDDYERLFD